MSFKIESIGGPAARLYSYFVAHVPVIEDFYKDVTGEVVSHSTSGRVLDIGTGPGLVPLEIAAKAPNLEIKAIDISQAMVDIAKKNAQHAGLSNRVDFKYGSAASIPFEDGYFDLVISTLSFHHWAKPLEGLKEIQRVLKSGGEAWIFDLRRDPTKEAQKNLRSRYGWFVAGFILNFVVLHSSERLGTFQELSAMPNQGFSEKSVEDRGIFLKLRLRK